MSENATWEERLADGAKDWNELMQRLEAIRTARESGCMAVWEGREQ